MPSQDKQATHTPGPMTVHNPFAPFDVCRIGDSGRWHGVYRGDVRLWESRGDQSEFRCAEVAELLARANRRTALESAAPDHVMVLRLLASKAMRWEPFPSGDDRGELCFLGIRHATQLDDCGCPMLTDGLRAAIARATA